MTSQEIAMQLTLKAMDLRLISANVHNEQAENEKLIAKFYAAMYDVIINPDKYIDEVES